MRRKDLLQNLTNQRKRKESFLKINCQEGTVLANAFEQGVSVKVLFLMIALFFGSLFFFFCH